jgi:hypothetical protein
VRRATSEFDVTIETNALGLRDDALAAPGKPPGKGRVLCLGDSFVLGYTVGRDDLFVDLLERLWQAEGRPLDVVNGGTEGWSTDQEVVWLERHGLEFQPDLVLLFPYENDLYWNGELAYGRYPKPRFSTAGPREPIALRDPGPQAWHERTALGGFVAASSQARTRWSPDGRRELEREWAAYWREPPEFLAQALLRTRAALARAKELCDARDARLVVVPIPGKAAVVPAARAALEDAVLGRSALAQLLGRAPSAAPELEPGAAWSADVPVERYLALARELGIESLDARPALRAAAERGEALYFERDWHLDPSGNRALAAFLHGEIDRAGWLGPELAPRQSAALQPARERGGFPRWPIWYAGLVLVLGTLYARTYRDVGAARAYLFVAGLLGLVFAIAIGGTWLLGLLPPLVARVALGAFVLGLLSFVLIKLGRRLGTIAELLVCFTRRGHWYLMPLVIVLLTVGSLLVVAASSPLVAPFIYTLF